MLIINAISHRLRNAIWKCRQMGVVDFSSFSCERENEENHSSA